MSSRAWTPAATLVAAALLAGGCDSGAALDGGAAPDATEPLAAWCDPELWDFVWDVEGLPPPGTPPTWVPNPRIPFERPSGGGDQTHFWMPWDMNVRQAYYLRSGEDVHLRLRFMVGVDGPDAGTVHLRVFIDGRLASFSHEGSTTRELLTPLEEGLGETRILIPADAFRIGLSKVHLNFRYDFNEADHLYPFDRFWGFSVGREFADSGAEFRQTPGFEVEPAEFGYNTRIFWEDETRGELDFFRWAEGLPWEGEEVDLVIRAQGDPRIDHCGGEFLDVSALVALLDGEPVPLGDFDRLITKVPPGVQHVFRTRLHLPRDGMRHKFEVFSFSGLGRPARLEGGGRFTPWRGDGRRVTILQWDN